jgi:hypothetical protein
MLHMHMPVLVHRQHFVVLRLLLPSTDPYILGRQMGGASNIVVLMVEENILTRVMPITGYLLHPLIRRRTRVQICQPLCVVHLLHQSHLGAHLLRPLFLCLLCQHCHLI